MDLQESKSTCGNAVVREIIKTLDSKHFSNYVPLERECSSFLSIKNELEEKGQYVTAYKDYILPNKIEKGELILAQILKDEILHFVLIKRIKKNIVTYFDPSIGLLDIKKDLFLLNFTGNAMIIKRGKGVKKKVRMPKLIDDFTKFLLSFLAIIRGVSSLGFFLLISDTKYAKYSLIFLSLFLLSLILTTLIIQWKIKKNMDNIVFPYIRITSLNNYEDAMTTISLSYKLFENKLDKLTFICISFIFVLTQNFIFIWLFIITIIMFVSINILTEKLLEKKMALSTYYETSFLDELKAKNNIQKAKKTFIKARKNSFNYLKIILISRGICLALVAILLIGFMYFIDRNEISYFVSTYAIFSSIGLAISTINNSKEESELRKKIYRLGKTYTSYL